MKLKNKRVLITAGPTWVPIDKVRVISNQATGKTGILLAEQLQARGAKVTLLLGPVGAYCPQSNIKLLRFTFFEELRRMLEKELSLKHYDAVIHSAAVADYKPVGHFSRKVKSNLRKWCLELMPTRKLIDTIKKIDPAVFLVGFKFEPGVGAALLLVRAKALLRRSGADLVVANTVNNQRYEAYLVYPHGTLGPFKSKNRLALEVGKQLYKTIS